MAFVREFNCAIIRSKGKKRLSQIDEPIDGKIFTFEDKYMRGSKNAKGEPKAAGKLGTKQGGMDSMDRRIPADIPEEQSKLINRKKNSL